MLICSLIFQPFCNGLAKSNKCSAMEVQGWLKVTFGFILYIHSDTKARTHFVGSI